MVNAGEVRVDYLPEYRDFDPLQEVSISSYKNYFLRETNSFQRILQEKKWSR